MEETNSLRKTTIVDRRLSGNKNRKERIGNEDITVCERGGKCRILANGKYRRVTRFGIENKLLLFRTTEDPKKYLYAGNK